jgi:hypothetical protein
MVKSKIYSPHERETSVRACGLAESAQSGLHKSRALSLKQEETLTE